jgi:hypothetical protein
VTLGNDVAQALPALRAAAESMHRDTFTVFRKTGATTTNPVTLEEVAQFAVVHEDVKGKLKQGEGSGEDVDIPGAVVVASGLVWHTSVTVAGIRTDDEVECTAVDGVTGDPDLVGVRVRVTGPFLRSIATARRFPVQELS